MLLRHLFPWGLLKYLIMPVYMMHKQRLTQLHRQSREQKGEVAFSSEGAATKVAFSSEGAPTKSILDRRHSHVDTTRNYSRMAQRAVAWTQLFTELGQVKYLLARSSEALAIELWFQIFSWLLSLVLRLKVLAPLAPLQMLDCVFQLQRLTVATDSSCYLHTLNSSYSRFFSVEMPGLRNDHIK